MTITVNQLLATLSVDEAQAAVVSGRLVLILRSPQPNEGDVPVDTAFTLTVVDLEGEAWDTSLGKVRVLSIELDGTKIYEIGPGWTAGWIGTETPHATSDPYRYRRMDATQVAPPYFTSEQVVTVRVVADVDFVPGSGIDETYTFTCEDITPPKLLSAESRDEFTIRVAFDDEMATSGTGSVLDASLWTVIRNNVNPQCGVNLTVVSVVEVVGSGGTEFDLTFNWEMTPDCPYTAVIDASAEDSSGNAMDPTGLEADFMGYAPAHPANRDFSYWFQMLPLKNRQEDATQDLRRWACCVQQVLNLLLISVDRYTDQFDPDLASDATVDAMLWDMGNPFDWADLDLTAEQKRKLLRYLVTIYKLKGTAAGIEAVAFFLLGIVCRVVDYNSDGWVLGVDVLGEGEIATVYSEAFAPYDLTAVAQPPEVEIAVNDGAPQTATFVAGPATLQNGVDQTWDFSAPGVEVLNVTVDGTPQVVPFPDAFFAVPAAATPAEVAAALTAGLVGATGVVSGAGQRVSIETTGKGTGHTIRVTGGNANPILQFQTTEVAGTGDVASLAAVTADEAVAIVAAAVSGAGAYVVHSGSPAILATLAAEPYAIVGGDTMVLQINDEPSTRTVTFKASDFAIPGAATADEVSGALNTALWGVCEAFDVGGLAQIHTLLTGDNAKLQVAGGTVAGLFPPGLVTGDDDDWRFAIYSETPGVDASIEVAGGSANGVFDFSLDPSSGTGSAELAPSDLHTIYSFDIEHDGVITSEQESIIRKIAEYMKPAHTHLKEIRPPHGLPWPDGWFLGEGELGDDTELST